MEKIFLSKEELIERNEVLRSAIQLHYDRSYPKRQEGSFKAFRHMRVIDHELYVAAGVMSPPENF